MIIWPYVHFSLWIILLLQTNSNSANSAERLVNKNLSNTTEKIDCIQVCIPIQLLCDGIPHCSNGFDEENCGGICGTSDAFLCKNDRCIPQYSRCDGYDDCQDGSDEKDCSELNSPLKKKENIDVPISIKHIDVTNPIITDYSIHTNDEDYSGIELVAYKTIRPDESLDARTVVFSNMRKVVIYIHGFRTESMDDGKEMKNAFINGADDVDCVILVDWRNGSTPATPDNPHDGLIEYWPWHRAEDYLIVVTHSLPYVSDVLVQFIKEKLTNDVKVHLIGYSLGGQIAGMVGRTLQTSEKPRTIERISALDPAGPYFEYSYLSLPINTEHTLRSTDATFVDVIHASKFLGMIKAAGDVDFYMTEDTCSLFTCTHKMAVIVYIASINECSQIACPMEMLNGHVCNLKPYSDVSSLGYLADLYDGRSLYSINMKGSCSDIFNIDLPAKLRICHEPPTVTSGCKLKPYFTFCKENCLNLTFSYTTCNINENKKDHVEWVGKKCSRSITCMNEDHESVKYFLVYKLPSSYEYYYIYRTMDDTAGWRAEDIEWKKGSHPVTDGRSALGATLGPIYNSLEPLTFMMWNDELPLNSRSMLFQHENTTDSDIVDFSAAFGHSKGALVYNEKGGFLLSHSVPRYPPNPDLTKNYNFPSNGKVNGQMALCVTSGNQYEEEIILLLDRMKYFTPQVYAANVQTSLSPQIKDKFVEVINPRKKEKKGKKDKDEKPVYHIGSMPYGLHAVVHTFGSSKRPNETNCFREIAKIYETSIIVQTWPDRKAQNKLASVCDGDYTIENIENVMLADGNKWGRHVDHSKWIVSKSVTHHVVCVGDINMAHSTMARGGLFVCISDEVLHSYFGYDPDMPDLSSHKISCSQLEACNKME